MIHKKIILSTSNQNKIKEFQRFGLNFDVVNGKDLKEVNSNIDDVIKYKALEASKTNDNVLVEDTVLIVNGEEIVDIRWRIKELSQLKNPEILWVVSLGIVDNGVFYRYKSSINCCIVDNVENITIPEDAFGFDPYLMPFVSDIVTPYTFYELEKMNMKDDFSPRKFVIDNLIDGFYEEATPVSEIPDWTGDYQ